MQVETSGTEVHRTAHKRQTSDRHRETNFQANSGY